MQPDGGEKLLDKSLRNNPSTLNHQFNKNLTISDKILEQLQAT